MDDPLNDLASAAKTSRAPSRSKPQNNLPSKWVVVAIVLGALFVIGLILPKSPPRTSAGAGENLNATPGEPEYGLKVNKESPQLHVVDILYKTPVSFEVAERTLRRELTKFAMLNPSVDYIGYAYDTSTHPERVIVKPDQTYVFSASKKRMMTYSEAKQANALR